MNKDKKVLLVKIEYNNRLIDGAKKSGDTDMINKYKGNIQQCMELLNNIKRRSFNE